MKSILKMSRNNFQNESRADGLFETEMQSDFEMGQRPIDRFDLLTVLIMDHNL